jgi:hypothetical protein
MAGGRPSKFKLEFVEQARKLATLGATDREAADFFDVNEATLNRWKHTYPEFCASLKVGKAAADERVEQALYRRAVGYSHDAVKIAVNAQGDVTKVDFTEHYPPDTTAGIFWLKNRKPEEWRDRQQIEHSGEVEVTDARERIARVVAGHIAAGTAVENTGKPH